MVFDSISRLGRYANIVPGMDEIVRIVSSGELETLPAGRHETSADGLYFMINEYDPKDESEASFEFHKFCADVQVMVDGEETCFYSSAPAPLELIDSEADDIAFVDDEKEEECTLTKGVFVIYFPGELHAPGIKKSVEHCRKAVFKVRM